MKLADLTTNVKKNIPEDGSYNPKYIASICLLFSVLIFCRALNNVFFYVFAVISFIVILKSSNKHCISLLFFLLPFSSILKPNVDGTSFFTILFFLVVIKMVIENPRINIKLLICVLSFCLYNFVFSGVGQLATIITMLVGMIMLYYLRNIETNAEITIIAYNAGICLASILALAKNSFPIINTYITDIALGLGDESIIRFSGLQGNPNYYTLDVIVALSAIVVLIYNNKRTKKVYMIFMVALSIFGLMSVSKSFIITWVILMICWLIISFRQGVEKIIKFILFAIFAAAIAYLFAHDYINAYFYRFAGSGTGTIDSFTTGRTDIWISYIHEIFNNFKSLLFGNGLNSIIEEIGKGPHNTYLDIVFDLGIIGATIFFISLRYTFGKITLKGAIWIPLLVLMIRMFAISILIYDNLWFYLAVLQILICDVRKKQALIDNER